MRLLTGRPMAGTPSPCLPRLATRVATVAHRGASAYTPENTLAAVRAAVALGASDVEVDVQRTADGALVVMHDTTLSRTTDVERHLPGRGPWRVGDLTYATVRRLDAGSWASPAHAGERVPLLTEVLDVLRGTGTGLLLEVKAPHLYPGIESDLATELDHHRGSERLVVQSFDHGSMRRFKDLAPHLPVGLLGTPPRRRLRTLAAWADQVNPRHRAVRPGYVDAVHQAGMACQVWTVDGVADMTRALGMGVDGVISNRPDVLRAVLNGRLASVA